MLGHALEGTLGVCGARLSFFMVVPVQLVFGFALCRRSAFRFCTIVGGPDCEREEGGKEVRMKGPGPGYALPFGPIGAKLGGVLKRP